MTSSDVIVVTFPGTTALELIKKAAYCMSAAFSFEFMASDGEVVVRMLPLGALDHKGREDAAHRLRNEVLDQELRQVIAVETEAVRNAVLAYAFSRTGLQDEQIQEF